MLIKQIWKQVILVCLLLTVMCPAFGAADKAHDSITASDCSPYPRGVMWAINSSGELFRWYAPNYKATSSLDSSHVRSSGAALSPPTAANMAHYHFFTYDMQAAFSNTSTPTTTQVNAYWDTRFGYNEDSANGMVRTGTPTVQFTCHEYALSTSSHATGTYNYVISAPVTLRARDMAVATAAVQNDILGYSDHSTLVTVASGGVPSELQWKWGESAIYTLTVLPVGHECDTPMRVDEDHFEDNTAGQTPDSMGWEWNESYRTGPVIYTAP